MKKEMGIILTICLLISISFILVGCKHDKIQFNAQSKFQQTMKQLNKPGFGKTYETKNSSGVVIFKDKRYSEDSSGMTFGPKDINFDLGIK